MTHAELGDMVTSHPVDNARRRTIAVLGFGMGVAGLAIIGVLGLGRSTLLDFAVMVTAVGLTAGVQSLVLAVRGGPDESFVVHTDGLSYTNRSGTRRWRWAELAYLRVHRPRFPGPGGEFFGSQLRATIHPRVGRPVRFTGLTHDHDTLVAAVRAHCDPVPPTAFRERARWLGLTVASLAVIGLLLLYARATRRITDYDSGSLVVVQPGLGATGIILVLTGLFVCLAAAVFGIVKALRRN